MVGFPIEVGVVVGAAAAVDFDEPRSPMPAAAAPPIAAAMINHLVREWCEAVNVPSPPAFTVSLRYWVTATPARAGPLEAVTLISKAPDVLFHCMPQTVAVPSALVVTISVLPPPANDPPGP